MEIFRKVIKTITSDRQQEYRPDFNDFVSENNIVLNDFLNNEVPPAKNTQCQDVPGLYICTQQGFNDFLWCGKNHPFGIFCELLQKSILKMYPGQYSQDRIIYSRSQPLSEEFVFLAGSDDNRVKEETIDNLKSETATIRRTNQNKNEDNGTAKYYGNIHNEKYQGISDLIINNDDTKEHYDLVENNEQVYIITDMFTLSLYKARVFYMGFDTIFMNILIEKAKKNTFVNSQEILNFREILNDTQEIDAVSHFSKCFTLLNQLKDLDSTPEEFKKQIGEIGEKYKSFILKE